MEFNLFEAAQITRNRGGQVLVKVLFNEQETLISSKCKPYSGPYYRWEDFRSFVESKL